MFFFYVAYPRAFCENWNQKESLGVHFDQKLKEDSSEDTARIVETLSTWSSPGVDSRRSSEYRRWLAAPSHAPVEWCGGESASATTGLCINMLC